MKEFGKNYLDIYLFEIVYAKLFNLIQVQVSGIGQKARRNTILSPWLQCV